MSDFTAIVLLLAPFLSSYFVCGVRARPVARSGVPVVAPGALAVVTPLVE